MVWSKDLAKLKQDLKAQDGSVSAPPAHCVKPAPAPQSPKSLEEEDALFLSAVGRAIAIIPKNREALGEKSEFEKAMSQLKGVKPTRSDIPTSAPQAYIQSAVEEEDAGDIGAMIALVEVAGEDTPEDDESHDSVEQTKKGAEKIQLAAGMVIEVDGVLDLRNHNSEDAVERLKERVYDGAFLGWRTLHVILGNSEPLRQVFFDYIDSPQSSPLTKYAQAPLPMGGAQAWVLYFGHR